MDFLDISTAQNNRLVTEFLRFGPICALGSCTKRGTVKKFWLIFSTSYNFGIERTFWKFSVLKMIVLSLAI